MRQRLFWRYLAFIFPVVILGLFFLAVSHYFESRKNYLEKYHIQSRHILEQTRQSLKLWIEGNRAVLRALAEEPEILNAARNPEDAQVRKRAGKILNSFHRQYPYVMNVPLLVVLPSSKSFEIQEKGKKLSISSGSIVVDTLGESVGINLSQLDYVQALLRGKDQYLGKPYFSLAIGKPIFVLSQAVRENRTLIGILLMGIRLDYFTDLFIDPIRFGTTGYLLMIDHLGQVMAHPKKSWILNEVPEGTKKIINRVIRGEIWFEEKLFHEDRRYEAVTFNAGDMENWHLIVSQSKSELDSLSKAHLIEDLIFYLGIAVVLFVLIFLITRRLVTNPIHQLIHRLAAIFKTPGTLSVRLEQFQMPDRIRKDEIGVLYRYFEEFIDHLKKYSVENEKLNFYLQQVIDSSPDGIAIFSSSGKLKDMNRAWVALTGFGNSDIGISAERIFSQFHWDLDFWQRGQSLQKGQEVNLNQILSTASQKELPVLVRLRPLDLSEADLDILCLVTDISEEKKLQMKLEEALRRAEEGSRAKSEFLANMSHELRTPMNGIMGMTDILLDTLLSEEQRSFLDIVKLSSDNLLAIINDILDLSRIEAGKMELLEEGFDLNLFFRNLMDSFRLMAHKKGLELILEKEIPAHWVIGDSFRFRQILSNLISNALKFTEKGEVWLRISGTLQKQNRMILEITVKDSGVGIPAEKIGMIFDNFTQVDSSNTRKYGGTGLGLAIVRKLTDMMGGTVSVQSEEKLGSEFRVILPMRLEEGQLGVGRISAPLADLSGISVLVVDDNAANRLILEKKLAKWNCRVSSVAGGREALSWLARNHADIMILDYQMPELDGMETLEQLRRENLRHTPEVILLTSIEIAHQDQRMKKLGIYGVLIKPVDFEWLYEVLSGALSGSQSDAKYISEKVPDKKILLVEDNEMNRLTTRIMLQNLGYQVFIGRNGEEGVTLFAQEGADLIFMDIQMPVMNGFDATLAIRSLPGGKTVPVVAITALAFAEDRERCFAAGMNDIVVKPCSLAEIKKVLRQWL